MLKVTSLVIAFALLVSVPVFAEGKCCSMGGKAGSSEKKADRLKEKLALNDAQAAQIQTIMDAKKAKMEALKTETQGQMAAVLTPEQNEKYKAMKEEYKEKRGEHKEHHS